MPGSPKQPDPRTGARYLSLIIGQRVSDVRRLRGVSQTALATLMLDMGHSTWRRQTVGQIEKAERNLTVDEMISLAVALDTTLAYLMSPASALDPNYHGPVDVGRSEPIEGKELRELYGFTWLPYPQQRSTTAELAKSFEEDNNDEETKE